MSELPSTDATRAPSRHPRSIAILVMGIISVPFIFGLVLGPIAFVMGTRALHEIDAQPTAYSGRSMVSAGRVLGAIGFGINVIALLWRFTS